MSKTLTFLDMAFWITETDANPKHVASLQILERSENASDDYVENFVTELRGHTQANAPFNSVVRTILGIPVNLKPVAELDMDYHVQYHQVENVADMAQMHALTARLHEPRLDKKQPLWQYHIIDSQQGDSFAVYIKIHHLYGDGASLVRWFQSAYNSEADSSDFKPVWTLDHHRKKRAPARKPWYSPLKKAWSALITLKDLFWILCRLLFKLCRINQAYMPIPFTGTKTLLTGQVTAGRVVATTDLDFNRVQALSRTMRASVNEIFLCCFDIGVHQFLRDHGHSFNKALLTNMPINLRKPGDQVGGNKIAIVPVKLAYGTKDPYLRLRGIIENHRTVKKVAKACTPSSFGYYTILIQSFSLVFELLRVSEWFRPIANILISNVPGPKGVHYLKDARLKASYPISTITPGGGVNITLLTYDNRANVGIVCCDKHIKDLQPMADYFNQAFEMLEQSVSDANLSIENIGEQPRPVEKSIVEEPPVTLDKVVHE